MINNRLNIERERRWFAFEQAREASSNPRYAAYVEKVLMYLYTNGLGNTLAFIFSKKGPDGQDKQAWEAIYGQIYDWLQGHYHLTKGKLSREEMAGQLVGPGFSEAHYRATTRELLKLFEALKRYTKSPTNNEASALENQAGS